VLEEEVIINQILNLFTAKEAKAVRLKAREANPRVLQTTLKLNLDSSQQVKNYSKFSARRFSPEELEEFSASGDYSEMLTMMAADRLT